MVEYKNIKIEESSYNKLKSLAESKNKTISEIINLLVEYGRIEVEQTLKKDTIQEVEKYLIKIPQLENSVKQHTNDIIEIQDKLQQLAVLNKWRLY